jgi:hypothetical protein
LRKRGGLLEKRLHPFFQDRNLLIQSIDLSQELGKQKAVMCGHTTHQSPIQFSPFLPQGSLCQLGQNVWIFLPAYQSSQDR